MKKAYLEKLKAIVFYEANQQCLLDLVGQPLLVGNETDAKMAITYEP